MRKIMKLSFVTTLLAIMVLSVPVWAGPMGPHVERVADTGKGNFAGGLFAKTFTRIVDGQPQTFAHIFICADKKSIPALRALGVEINTVTSSGIMTAIAPVAKLRAIAAVAGVRKIEAGHALKLFMDISAGTDGVNLPDTNYPRAENTGNGVIIGVIDSGIDIEHPDFMDANGTRIIAIWDHTLDPADVGYAAGNPAGFTYGTEWLSTSIEEGYAVCLHRDNNGHGTHVAGTAAGNGSATSYEGPYVGLAPEAELLIVKFDLENEKDRNADTFLLDGINWIFQKAGAEGKPCVINMSLGNDFGPHDGSTAEERGIDDLTGPNKIVCVSAGNAATPYSNDLDKFGLWGPPIHGSGNFTTDYDVVLTTEADYQPGDPDYIFFDIWYPGADTCRVQITTPGSNKYPPHFRGPYRNVWKTDGSSGAFNTAEGCIYVQNISGASTIWETDNGDNNIYIEISDYYGPNPAPGKWVVEIIPLTGSGEYHSWHGFSDSLTKTYFWYDSGTTDHAWGDLSDDQYLSDSVMTTGKPATASQVISVGAYQTKTEWPGRLYDNPADPNSPFSLVLQAYGVAPIDYYYPFSMYDLAFFSSRGPSRDGRVQPFIAAPGVGIVASLSQTVLNDPAEDYYRRLNRVEFGGYYATLQGTSMACPHATGSVALLLEEAMNQGLSPGSDEIKGYLEQGARVDGYTGSVSNNDWGYGKIDVTGALAQVQPPPLIITTDSLPDGTVGVLYSETLEATGGTPPYTWAIDSGSLPDGLFLVQVEGEEIATISGTPLSQGESPFTVKVTDASADIATKGFSITINPAGALPPVVSSCNPASGYQNERLSVTISGANFQGGATVNFGAGIAVQTTSVNSATEIVCGIKINKKASTGFRDVTVTNPDGESGTLLNGFEVTVQ